MSKTWTIYCVKHTPTGRHYVGQTHHTLEHRKAQHIYQARYGKLKLFHRALVAHEPEEFEWRVLMTDITSLSEACRLESLWIHELKSHVTMNGFNLTFGGEGSSGFKHTDESRKKIGDRFRGIPKSQEQRLKMGKAISNSKIEPKHISNVGLESKSAGKHHSCKAVVQLDLGNQVVAEFTSVTDAARHMNVSSSAISGCCNGKIHTVAGYYWHFKSAVHSAACVVPCKDDAAADC